MSELTPEQQEEFETLKVRAEQLGIKVGRKGLDKLREEVNAALGSSDDEEEIPKGETKAQKQQRLKKKALELVRVQVTCMNPNKKDWTGETFKASNRYVPAVTKFVPFNAEDGWHVPRIILNMMRERKCQVFKTVTNRKTGQKTRKGYQINEFNIAELEPLTEKELKDLATQQKAANELDD